MKNGRIDCKHIFAEKLRREEFVVVGELAVRDRPPRQASRRPAKDRVAENGLMRRTTQGHARIRLPKRLPELGALLVETHESTPREAPAPKRIEGKHPGGPKETPLSTQALALLLKVAARTSAETMAQAYCSHIDRGLLGLTRAPSKNTISRWFNDPRLTPVLQKFLIMTSLPFRTQESICIIDSTKLSQLMFGHARSVFYGTDRRDNADWMKGHVVIGRQTMVVMAAAFSGSRGSDLTHDLNFMLPLLDEARKFFKIDYVLADKAYLAANIVRELSGRQISAYIPLKKGVWQEGERVTWDQPILELVELFTRNNNRDFHELFRFRAKIEALFSIIKRVADGYCWTC